MRAQQCTSCRNKYRACDCCTTENGHSNYEEKSEFHAIFGVTMSAREVALEKEKSDANFLESVWAIQKREIKNMISMGKALGKPNLSKVAIEEYVGEEE